MSDMPDFDSMTPEELMKWMESLAVRQGATEGLTTSADMAVAEVSADDERLAGKGDYVPYGWTEDKWKERLAKEEEEKKAKGQAAPAAAKPAPEPEAAPPPAPEPVAQASQPSAASSTPDFDSMTPEELMKWMESLAVRQGATEGLTTSADMAVEEVDASDERLAGKGDYVPYGWTEDKWKERLAKEEEEKRAKGKAAGAAAPKATPEPEFEFEEEAEASFEMPDFDTVEETGTMEPIAANPMDWLSSLGAPDDSLPNLELNLDVLGDLAVNEESGGDPMAWLSGLSNDTGSDALASLSALANDEASEEDSLSWMTFDSEDASPAEEGSLEWMESLAARQGADSEELVTDARFNIPEPLNLDDTSPGYEEFSFEKATGVMPDSERMPAVGVPELNLEDPESWLDNLASGSNIIGGGDDDEEDDDFFLEELEEEEEAPSHNFEAIAEDVKSKLDKGTASPEEIEQFFMHAFTKAGERTDVEDYLESGDSEESDIAMPVQAEIPDWLRDSMETMEAVEEETVNAPRPSDTGEMMAAQLFGDEAAPIPAELPDWLSTGMGEDTGAIGEDIFAVVEESPATPAFALDTQDTWVEAFSQEESGELAEWYENAVAGLESGELPAAAALVGSLAVANLPDEDSLQPGTPMRVPDWLSGEVTVIESVEVAATLVDDMDWLTTDEAAAVEADMPDWLKDTVDDSVTADDALPEWLQGENLDIAPADIPDWLRETVEEEEVTSILSEPVQAKPTPPAPVPTPPAPKPMTMPAVVKQSPAPVPVAVANIDVAATLQSAQSKLGSGDIAGAILDYEQVIRANAALPQVESAMQKLADDKNHKGNPAVHRVLGDVLMRQGKLQQALDTYRKALNLL
jgi:hypothetical protein